MPFVAPKSTTNSSTVAAGRTTFRPPWVKDDGAQSGLKPTTKTSVPWARKTAEDKDAATTDKPKLNSTTSILKKPTTNTAKVNAEPTPLKKTNEPVKKIAEAATKKPTTTTLNSSKTHVAKSAMAKKKEPTPPPSSSSEEEEEEETEEESEEETEEESEEEEEESEEEEEEESEEEESEEEEVKPKPAATKKPQTTTTPPKSSNTTTTKAPAPAPAPTKKIIPPKAVAPPKKEEEESELKRRFSIEKPKLRPVVVKRDKSMKKIEDDDEAVDGETEEERERRLRFKLEKPKLRHVKREEKPLPSKSTDNILKIRPVLKKVPKVDEIIKETKEEPKPEFKTKTLRKTPSIKRELSIKNVPAPPPLPSLVPKAPPPPPPPLGKPGEKKELTEQRKQAIEKLKTRPRRRPDWSEMMKEVEDGSRKLRHVECNDRSQPILVCKSMTKVDDKFIFETEKDNSHNKLLQQIQGGLKLKPTRTNDRSKPFIEGLRKFRRQMTIEEQIQKSQSKINMLASIPGGAGSDTTDGVAPSASSTRAGSIVSALAVDLDGSGDELDDIDKIRDDLQSTKQMLAFELRNREAQERENKKLLAKIATLAAELEREKSREKTLEYGSRIIVATMETTPASEEAYVNTLKHEAEESKKSAKDLETKYLSTGEMLDQAKSEIEEQKRQIQMLERKLAQALQGGGLDSRRPSDVHNGREDSPDFDLAESESDPDEPEEKKTERRERRLVKEVKVLRTKLTKIKVKEEAAKKEKAALKEAMKKNHVILKEENKKFKKLEKEVHKMAASMKEDAEDDEDKDEDEEKDEDEGEEEESEEESDEESEESESEESGNETESESEAEDAPTSSKKDNLEPRLKKHEGRLTAMKKCNVLLQANVDNLQDEISQTRYKASNLQSELDSVLADLGF